MRIPTPDRSRVTVLLTRQREYLRAGVRDHLEQTRKSGEIPPRKDVATLTVLFDTFLFGITTQTRNAPQWARAGVFCARLREAWGIDRTILPVPRAVASHREP